MIESLEARRLLTGSFDPATGFATITGTDLQDRIEFEVGRSAFFVNTTTSGQTTRDGFDVARVTRVIVRSLGGPDIVILGNLLIPAEVDGGRANDTLSGGRANDTLRGGGGDDYLFGSDGNDLIDGESEGDAIFGGAGTDTVDYSRRTLDLVIGLGTLPDDGQAGEGDNVSTDIEVVLGGSGNDHVSTTSGKRIEFHGRDGNDTLIGGSGADVFDGGRGTDSMIGNGGNDLFHAIDGEMDFINGGSGEDVANSDSLDVVQNVP